MIQVPIEFPNSNDSDVMVKDLNCGKEMRKKDARHVLFRTGEALFFCSRECLDRFCAFKTVPNERSHG